MRFFDLNTVKQLSHSKLSGLNLSCLLALFCTSLLSCQEKPKWAHAIPESAQLISNLPAKQYAGQHQLIARIWMEYTLNQADWLYLYESGFQFVDLAKMKKLRQTLYRGVNIQHYRNGQGRTLVFANLKGVNILAAHAIMVEEAIRSLKSGSTALQKLASHLDWKRQETLLIGPEFNKKDRHFPVNRPYRGIALQRDFGEKNWRGTLFFVQKRKKLNAKQARQNWAQLQEATPANAWQIEPYWPDPKQAPKWMRSCKGLAQLAYLGENPGSSACLMLAGKHARAWSKLTRNLPAQQEQNYQAFHLQIWSNRALDPLGRSRFVAFYMQNTLVLASSIDAAERWIDAFVVGNTLAQKSPFVGSSCNARLDPDLGLGAVIKQGLNIATYPSPQNSPFLLKGESSRKSWHFSLDWTPSVENEALAWQLDLETAVQGMWPLPAHQAVLAQTQDGELISLNAEGRVKWRQKINAPIIGAPCEADFGEKTALFFGAGKYLYGLDTSGQLLPGFPWPAELSPGLCVGGLNPYFFYPGKNGYVYGLDREGRPLASWNPGPYADAQNFPLQFFQADGQDFLLLRNAQNQVQVLNRDAMDHFPPIQLEGESNHPIFYQWTAKHKRMVVAEKGGKARIIGPDGQSFMLSLALDGFGGTPQLWFANLWGDERKDYLALGGKTLTLNGYEGQNFKLLRKKELPFEATQLFGEGSNIGLRHLGKQQAWVLDREWNVLPIFPVKAEYTCFFPGKNLLVCAFQGRLFAIKTAK